MRTIEAIGIVAGRENRILAALPPSDRRQLFAVASSVSFPVKTVLFEPGRPIDAVFFPVDGVISLVTPFQDGAMVEVATVGIEGIVGVPLVPFGGLAVRAIAGVATDVFDWMRPHFLNGQTAVMHSSGLSTATRRRCSVRSRSPQRATGCTRMMHGSPAGY